MVTINKVFDIPKAKGRGEFKILHCTFTDWGVTGAYNTGGVEVEIPDVRDVVAPLNATEKSCGYVLTPMSFSGKAIKLMARVTGTSGAVLQEVLSGTATSGVVSIDLAAVCEAE